MGYPSTQKGYKCYLPEKVIRYFVTMDVTFQEDVPFYSPNGKDVIYDESQGERVPPLVQSVPPPSYFGQIDDNREQGAGEANSANI